MTRIGSWQWLEETGGNLTGRERWSLLPALAGTFGRFSADRARLALGTKPRHSLSEADLWVDPPDSALCTNAEAEARDLQSEAVVNHGFRTWVFGMALSIVDDAPLDPEQFYSAALLHDAGLEHREPNVCFTHRSAVGARDAALKSGMTEQGAMSMMDGIGMHITPGLRVEDSAIGFYLQTGAMVDLAGVRAWELPPALRSRATEAYPRHDVHRVLSGCWRADAQGVPRGRAAFADRYGAFSRIVRYLPIDA